MSFTDQKPRIATEEECKAHWSGGYAGEKFRCHFCGHKFVPGDIWRFIFGFKTINFFVCQECDTGNDEELQEKMKANEEEAERRFWWLMKDCFACDNERAKFERD